MEDLVVFTIIILAPLFTLPASAAATGFAKNGPLQGSDVVGEASTTVGTGVSVKVGRGVGLGTGVSVDVDVGGMAAFVSATKVSAIAAAEA